MRMGDGNCQRIGRIGRFNTCGRQEPPDHGLHLFLAGVTDTDDAFLHLIRRVFSDMQSCARAREHGNGARLTELHGGRRILVYERLFDSERLRFDARKHIEQCLVKRKQSRRERIIVMGGQDTVRNMEEVPSRDFYRAPTHAGEAGIYAQNAHARHASPAESLALSFWEAPRPRNRNQTAASFRISASDSS
jgi:hypothetical protein